MRTQTSRRRRRARIRLTIPLAAWLRLAALSPGLAAAGSQPDPITTPPARDETKEGIAVEFEAVRSGAPHGGETGRPLLRQGDDAVIRFKVSDTTTGAPVRGAYPGAWIDRLAPGETLSQARTLQKAKSFVEGGLFGKADIDLTSYYALALNEDGTISVVDPLFSFGGSKLLATVALKGRGDDWVLSADQATLYVAMPDANAVAAIDTASWEVKASIATGRSPTRVALQPDQHYLWIANLGSGMEAPDQGVTVVSSGDLLIKAHIPAGRGPFELAFSNDSRFAFVLNRGSGSLSVINVASLNKQCDIPVGPRPASIAYCAEAGSIFVTDESSGQIVVVNAQRPEVSARINAEPGLGQVRFPPRGHLGFVVNPHTNLLHIIDASSNRMVQTGDMLKEPYQITFSDRLAYIRHRKTATVLMVPLDGIGVEGKPVPVVDFPGGQSDPGEGRIPSAADGIVQAPGGGAVLVANDKDRTIYYYKEGMAAPVGQFENYGHNPRAVLAVDRSLKERSRPGVYETVVRLPEPGSYEAIFLLDTPRLVKAFRFDVTANPELERKRQEADLVMVDYAAPQMIKSGERVPIRFKLAGGTAAKPETGLRDIVILTYLAPGLWHRRTPAEETAEGVYSITFEPPKPGIYHVHVLKNGEIVPTERGQPVILEVVDH